MDNQSKEENELMYIYEWVDSIPLSRPKKNISRDFSDGVLMAEIVKHYFPRLVELHNYPSASSTNQKLYNWTTLNAKVFKKLGFQVTKEEVKEIIDVKPLAVENLLKKLHRYIHNQNKISEKENNNSQDSFNNMSGSKNLMDGRSKGKFDDSSSNEKTLRKIIEEKDNNIQELKYIIEILEMKLNNAAEVQASLEKKVGELTETLARQKK